MATLILYLAYTGQAWNVMMGFAGQLSLGHSLYVGVGAYVAAGLFVHYGIGPWAGRVARDRDLRARRRGHRLPRLPLRHLRRLLRAADHRLRRVHAHRLRPPRLDRRPGGLFLKVAQRNHVDLLDFRGPPAMYYYAMLVLAAGALGLCAFLLRRRAGYYWQAIRENEEAAQALGINTFRWKMLAVVISSAMTAVAGVFFAFYYNNLFPEQIFNIGRSIEIILGPIIGGVGTLFGPIVGAVVLIAARRRHHRGAGRAGRRHSRRQAGRSRRGAARS